MTSGALAALPQPAARLWRMALRSGILLGLESYERAKARALTLSYVAVLPEAIRSTSGHPPPSTFSRLRLAYPFHRHCRDGDSLRHVQIPRTLGFRSRDVSGIAVNGLVNPFLSFGVFHSLRLRGTVTPSYVCYPRRRRATSSQTTSDAPLPPARRTRHPHRHPTSHPSPSDPPPSSRRSWPWLSSAVPPSPRPRTP